MTDLLHPNPNRSEALLRELTDILRPLTYVRRMMLFGSRVRNIHDCWSDLDMIVVTDSRRNFEFVYHALRLEKAIVHHNPLTPQVEPCGGHLLGVVFEGESVFHNLDLNFLSAADYQTPDSVQRFGQIIDLYVADNPAPQQLANEPPTPALPIEHPDEIRIGNALHWTKKAVKRMLRQQGTFDDVKMVCDALKRVMDDYPLDVMLPNGNISRVAHTYIEIADQLLTNPQGLNI